MHNRWSLKVVKVTLLLSACARRSCSRNKASRHPTSGLWRAQTRRRTGAVGIAMMESPVYSPQAQRTQPLWLEVSGMMMRASVAGSQ